ncbi:MAG: hypothetical protein GXP49_17400 [Deltaproteobacteria bacterium]|nr:hypothetical protein [Deltaproteobacteria bacterium]
MTSQEPTVQHKVRALLEEAELLLHEGRLDDAISRYTEILLHEKNHQGALKKLEVCWAVKRGEKTLDAVFVSDSEAVSMAEQVACKPVENFSLEYDQALPKVDQSGPVGMDEKGGAGSGTGILQEEKSERKSEEKSKIEQLPVVDRNTVLNLKISSNELQALNLDVLSIWALQQLDGKKSIEEVAESCLLEPEQALIIFEDLVFRGVVLPAGK